ANCINSFLLGDREPNIICFMMVKIVYYLCEGMENNSPHSKASVWNIQVSKALMYSAVVVTLTGMAVYAFESHHADYSVFTREYAFSFQHFIADLTQLKGYGIMSLGILLLVAIPFVKVLFFLIE